MTECKDCLKERVESATARPAGKPRPIVPKSGGRCATHHRNEKKRQKEQSHRRRVKSVYGLADGQYEAMYEFQGRKCAICQRATGASRRLSVDHDHATNLVRGLLCRPCNSMLGLARDDTAFFARAIRYLSYPPAFDSIGEVKPNDG